MGCCGGGTRIPSPAGRQRSGRRSAQRAPVTDTTPKEGQTLLKFVGAGNASRPFYGAITRYLFGGRNHLIGNVANSDVSILLAMTENGKRIFEVAPVLAPRTVIPVEAKVEAPVVAVKKPRKKKANAKPA